MGHRVHSLQARQRPKTVLVCSEYTLNSTFEEKGELAVHSEKEANWLSIQRLTLSLNLQPIHLLGTWN